jgi:hypothetical protein
MRRRHWKKKDPLPPHLQAVKERLMDKDYIDAALKKIADDLVGAIIGQGLKNNGIAGDKNAE